MTKQQWTSGFGDGKWSATHEDAFSCGWAPVEDAAGEVVAMALTVGRNDRDAERRDLIIKCVNAHDDLIEALRWVRANYASGPTAEINARIDATLTKAGA